MTRPSLVRSHSIPMQFACAWIYILVPKLIRLATKNEGSLTNRPGKRLVEYIRWSEKHIGDDRTGTHENDSNVACPW